MWREGPWPRWARILGWPLLFAARPIAKLARKWEREDPAGIARWNQREADRRIGRLGPDDRRVLYPRTQRAIALCHLGEYKKAEAEFRDVIVRLIRRGLAEDPILLSAHSWHLYAVVRLHQDADAEDDLRFLSEWYARQLGPDHPQTLHHREMHATALYAAGRPAAAAAVQADVVARLAATRGGRHPDTRRAERGLAAMRAGDFHVALRVEDSGA